MHYISYPTLAIPLNSTLINTTNPTQPNDQPSMPSIDTELLNASAHKFQELMEQANFLVMKIMQSHEFAYKLMEAAQLSNKEKVKELIASVGITLKVNINFTPTGFHIGFSNAEFEGRCCELKMALQW